MIGGGTVTKYQVHVENNGQIWPLRGTTWAFSMDRAQNFNTVEEARAALVKAKQFMKASIYKKARVVPVEI